MRLTINILLSISFVTISHFINLDKQLILMEFIVYFIDIEKLLIYVFNFIKYKIKCVTSNI